MLSPTQRSLFEGVSVSASLTIQADVGADDANGDIDDTVTDKVQLW